MTNLTLYWLIPKDRSSRVRWHHQEWPERHLLDLSRATLGKELDEISIGRHQPHQTLAPCQEV